MTFTKYEMQFLEWNWFFLTKMYKNANLLFYLAKMKAIGKKKKKKGNQIE